MRAHFVALLRGVNVGTGNRVAMADLRALLESLGFEQVRTVLNSGNAVFTASPKRAINAGVRIEAGLQTQLGVRSRVTLLSAAELDELVQGNPWAGESLHPSKLMLAVFADDSVAARLAPIQAHSWEPERLVVRQRAAYLWCPNGLSGSAMITPFARLLGDNVTTRNWATIGKLHAMCGGDGGGHRAPD